MLYFIGLLIGNKKPLSSKNFNKMPLLHDGYNLKKYQVQL